MAPLVLLTGVTGFLCSHILTATLRAGYRVCGTVRSNHKKSAVLKRPSVAPFIHNLELVIVESITQDRAFDHVLEGVEYIIHVASPAAQESDNYYRDVIEPAIKGTTGILYSAKKFPNIKRVVITSSAGALIPFEYYFTDDYTKVFKEEDAYIPNLDQKFANMYSAYFSAKAAALQATKTFVKEEKPHFDIVNTLTTYLIGPVEDATSPADITRHSNMFALRPILGIKTTIPIGALSTHLDDSVRLHVEALKPEIPVGDYVLSVPAIWDDAIEIVKRRFPDEVKAGKFPLDGTTPGRAVSVDSSKVERVFGWKPRSYEEQVVDVVKQILEFK